MVEYGNVFFVNTILEIGGIETYLYEIAKKYHEYDITVMYKNGDTKQLNRLRKLVRVIRKPSHVKCKKAFIPYECDLDGVEFEELIQVVHANYKVQTMPPNTDSRISKYVGVSKWVSDAYEELLTDRGVHKKVDVYYNPLTIEEPPKILKLVSATRLSSEKGSKRMVKLAELLNEKKIPFIWLIFTPDTHKIPTIPNVVLMPTRLDIRGYIKEADYLVQLSDTEGCPYSIRESLNLGTMVLVTPIPSVIELGVEEGKNGYILPYDMEGIDVERIYKGVKKFKYKDVGDRYEELLDKSHRTYEMHLEDVEVKAITGYEDIEMNKWISGGTKFTTSRARADELIKNGKVIEI